MIFYADHMHAAQTYERQEYLNGCKPPRLWTPLAKFRLRSHNLGMIADRWQLPEGEKICTRCHTQELDDEGHMLFRCERFNDWRTKYHELFRSGDDLADVMAMTAVYELARFIMEAERIINREGTYMNNKDEG